MLVKNNALLHLHNEKECRYTRMNADTCKLISIINIKLSKLRSTAIIKTG